MLSTLSMLYANITACCIGVSTVDIQERSRLALYCSARAKDVAPVLSERRFSFCMQARKTLLRAPVHVEKRAA